MVTSVHPVFKRSRAKMEGQQNITDSVSYHTHLLRVDSYQKLF